jgi:hypothetical protein
VFTWCFGELVAKMVLLSISLNFKQALNPSTNVVIFQKAGGADNG